MGEAFLLPFMLTDNGYVLGGSATADQDYHYFLWSDRIGMVDLGSTSISRGGFI